MFHWCSGEVWSYYTQTDLVQVGQTVWILAQALVLSPQPISCCNLPELLQVHHIEGAVEPKARKPCL